MRIRGWVLACGLALAGCGRSEDSSIPDAMADVVDARGVDSSSPPADGSDDAQVKDSGTDPDALAKDAGLDASDASGTDGAVVDAGAITAAVKVTLLYQNCMPVVSPDPILLQGSLEIVNAGGGSVGPVTATQGEIRDTANNLLTTFQLASPLSVGPVLSGQTGSGSFTKRAGSASPANRCQTLMCSSDVVILLPISGAGLPGGEIARSDKVRVMCVY